MGGFKKCSEKQSQIHEKAATGIVKMSAMQVPESTSLAFSPRKMLKNDEGNIPWGAKYFDPKARIKQRNTVIPGVENFKHRMTVKDDIIMNPRRTRRRR